jgi:hypothetical protein
MSSSQMPAEQPSKRSSTKLFSTAAPTGPTTSSTPPWLKLPVLGQLRMVVIDPKTRITLWNFTEYVRGAILQGNRDKNFSQAMNTIMARLKSLATPAAGDAITK